MAAVAALLDEARRFLGWIAQPGEVYELRCMSKRNGQQHIDGGYFDDVDALARAACSVSGKFDGVYVTINPVVPSLLFRAPKNRIDRKGNGDTTSDKDVAHRRHLLIDVDPVRPAGISSSDAEHTAAIEHAMRMRDHLGALGWPAPLLGDSGNGAHLVYPIDLPVDDGGLVQRTLNALHRRFSTSALKIDEKVFNPARISKVYGTLTRKGIDAPERPHRLARIVELP